MSKSDLRTVYLFKELSDESLTQIADNSTIRNVSSGNIIFYEGDKPEFFTILLEGVVKIYKSDMRQNEVILHYINAVSPIAELANIKEICYPATAQTLSTVKILQIPQSFFLEHILNNPKIAKELIKSLTTKIIILENVISNSITLNATARVAKFISTNAKIFSELKHHQIAAILNMKPETLSRSLAKLKKENIISDSLYIDILDIEKLKHYFL